MNRNKGELVFCSPVLKFFLITKKINTMTTKQQTTEQVNLSVAVGQKVSELLNLKFGKDGRTKTTWGTKSVQGLGACITRIVEEETERLKDY